jgi:signal transduction histidine kinase
VRLVQVRPGLGDAVARGDRAAVERGARELFDDLRQQHRVTHLYFTQPDRVALYRMHSPEAFGDRIDRSTMLQAHSRRQAASGLELGTMGTLTLRVVVPWALAPGAPAFVEVGEEVEHLLAEVRDALSVDLLVLLNKRVVDERQWQQGQRLMNRSGDWDRYASHVALAQTTTRLPPGLDEAALARLLAGRHVMLADDQRALHLAAVPLQDAGGRHIGELVIQRDVSGLQATFDNAMRAVVLFGLLVAGGVVAVFWLALDRVDADYRRQHDLELRLLQLNTEHERMLQVEKLSALGTMVGSVAHQLNNPLVGVVNLAQLAERDADDPARTRELLAEIRRAGQDCRGFVRRMLEFSRSSRYEARPTDLMGVVADTVALFRQAEARHLPVDVQQPEGGVPPLTVDPVLLRHALFNLLLNAAQATDGDAAISVTVHPQPHPHDGRPGWALTVADRGRGVPPDLLPRLFVPFFTTRSDGTGLGLPVVLHVALLHGGTVTAQPRDGGGMQFAIWLPQ